MGNRAFAIYLVGTTLLALVLLYSGCSRSTSPTARKREPIKPPADAFSQGVARIVGSEEMILSLTQRLSVLSRSTMNLHLPIGGATSLFSRDVALSDVGPVSNSSPINAYLGKREWVVEPPGRLGKLGIWSNLFSQIAFFETARFYIVSGEFGLQGQQFHTSLGFSGLARMADNSIGNVNAKIHVTWEWPDEKAAQMQITEWKTDKLDCIISDQFLFADVTDKSIGNSKWAYELGVSKHNEITRKLILGEPVDRPPNDSYLFFFPEVTLEHPAVSVVDLNRDGFDDFLVVRPHSPSLFFLNTGEGEFSEIGDQIGLRLPGGCTCSLFADYDNDGDQDLFVGRARKRAVYLENIEGVFRDRTQERINCELPFMVSSISSADIDNDGNLDVYFSTYSPIEGSHGIAVNKSIWPELFLSAPERKQYLERRSKAHPFIDMTGPPNLLLSNNGKGFDHSEYSDSVISWRKSFQASWSDFDQDGDPDLYVCNDFAPDDFYRNDGEKGFHRVSEEVGLDQLGFGMGVTWGDFNNDGTFDLYVSNMYSKAGKRITGQVKGLNPKFSEAATGNYLYELKDNHFELVSMDSGPQPAVARAGWAWGGQFSDLDNDGKLDILVANGYYSAPADLAEDIDL